MSDLQTELKIGLGTLEQEKSMLKPAKVKIVRVSIESTSKAKKVVFECKHPDRNETVKISSVAFLENKQVKVVGTWFNLDKESKIQKGSALHLVLTKLQANSISDAVGKDIDTELDNNYLCFKAY